jgi:hypothetical protein
VVVTLQSRARGVKGGKNEMSNLIRVCGLWTNTGRDGKKFLSGSIGQMKVLILPNNFKEKGSKHPDYNIFLAKKENIVDEPEETLFDKEEKEDKSIYEADIDDGDLPF